MGNKCRQINYLLNFPTNVVLCFCILFLSCLCSFCLISPTLEHMSFVETGLQQIAHLVGFLTTRQQGWVKTIMATKFWRRNGASAEWIALPRPLGDNKEDTKNISQMTAKATFCPKSIMVFTSRYFNHFHGWRHGKDAASTSWRVTVLGSELQAQATTANLMSCFHQHYC